MRPSTKRFLSTTVITYVFLSLSVLLWANAKAGPNPDGFGPGLVVYMMMIFVLPIVSPVVAGIISFARKP